MNHMRPAANSAHWQLTCASVRGKSHLAAGLPNQDWVEVRTTHAGNVVAAAIADGAGSASRSHVGARIACEMMAPCMLEIGIKVQNAGVSGEYVRERIVRSLIEVRERLSHMSHKLSDYHSTLVACVLTDAGGYVCQIGDSVALSTSFVGADDRDDRELDFFPDSKCRLFQPDRGEYANETHFITETDWASHLRITPIDISHIDAMVLMSDGAMDIATCKGEVFRGFLSNLIGKLLTVPLPQERERILTDWLADSRAHRATADDKTLFVAIRAKHLRLAHKPFRADVLRSDQAPAIIGKHQADSSEINPSGLRPSELESSDTRPADLKPQGDPRQVPPDEPPSPGKGGLLDRTLTWVILPVLILAFLVLSLALINLSVLNDSPDPPRPAKSTRVPAVHESRPTHASTEFSRPTSPLPPTSEPRKPAELIFVPSDQLELVVPAGATAQLKLRMILGNEAELVSVSSSEESALHVEPGSAGCAPLDHLTSRQPSCFIELRALKPNSKSKYRLDVVYRDPQFSEIHTLSLYVRLARADSK